MTQTRTICFISPYAYPLLVPHGKGPGGAERQFFLFGKGLSALGWRVSFITEYPDAKDEHQKTSLPVYPCSFSYMGGSNLRMPIDWLSFFRAMKKADSYYYIIKVPGHLLAPMGFFCRLFNRKLVFWGQMTFDADPSLRKINSFAGWLQDWGVKHTDIIIAQTKAQQSGFLKNYRKKSSVVPSICANLSNVSTRKKLSINSCHENIDVLWVGNSAVKKRYEVVIELAKLMPEMKFELAMNISDKARFVQADQDCQKIHNIDFLGMVPPSEIEVVFSQTKIFLNTSTQEGFPNTYLQAWMNGVPVISLNIDPDNVISTNDLGRIVSKQIFDEKIINFKYLASKLEPYIYELLVQDELRADIGQKAKDYIEENHSPRKVLPKLIAALHNSNKN